MRKRIMIITIDGPTASGKSSTARELAQKLHFFYINSGLLYRSLSCLALKQYPLNELPTLSSENIDALKVFHNHNDNNYDILIVRRNHNSTSLDDCKFYNTNNIIKLGLGKIDNSNLSYFLNEGLYHITFEKYHTSYGFYVEYYDVDNDYIILKHEDFY